VGDAREPVGSHAGDAAVIDGDADASPLVAAEAQRALGHDVVAPRVRHALEVTDDRLDLLWRLGPDRKRRAEVIGG
jgi:hypothetical protein